MRTDLEVFRPKPRRGDLIFGRGVGPGEANKPADVMRAQRLLSNAGTFRFAVPAERSGRPSSALTRATRAFEAGQGLAIDGRITKSGETLRGLDTTLFAADKGEEEFPENPSQIPNPKKPPDKEKPKDEKPEKPPKEMEDEKREICAALRRDLINISEQKEQVIKKIKATNKDLVNKNKQLEVLLKKRTDSVASTVGSGLVGVLTGGLRRRVN